MDYLSLFAAAKLLSLQTTLLRTAGAATLGGIYGVLAVVVGIDGFFGVLFTVLISVLLTIIAFGIGGGMPSLVRTTCTVWGCGALLGGIMTAFSAMFGGYYSGGGVDIVCAGVVALFGFVRLARRRLARGYVEIVIPFENRTFRGRALIDSGNLLTDPIGGYPVVLLRATEARTLVGELTDTVYRGNVENAPLGVRAVPVHTVDGTRLLYGFLCRDLLITRGRHIFRRCAVVCVDHGADISGGYGGCAALLPASLLL